MTSKNRTTYAGFYNPGKAKGDKVYQRVSPNYATQTTIPGSSVADVELGSRLKDFKSPS